VGEGRRQLGDPHTHQGVFNSNSARGKLGRVASSASLDSSMSDSYTYSYGEGALPAAAHDPNCTLGGNFTLDCSLEGLMDDYGLAIYTGLLCLGTQLFFTALFRAMPWTQRHPIFLAHQVRSLRRAPAPCVRQAILAASSPPQAPAVKPPALASPLARWLRSPS